MNILQIVNSLKSGGNPQALINQMVENNPQMKQILGNLQGKSEKELKEYAENLAKERGTDINTVLNSLGLK